MNNNIAVEVALLALGNRRHDCGMCIMRRPIWCFFEYFTWGRRSSKFCAEAEEQFKFKKECCTVQVGVDLPNANQIFKTMEIGRCTPVLRS